MKDLTPEMPEMPEMTDPRDDPRDETCWLDDYGDLCPRQARAMSGATMRNWSAV